MPDVRKRASLVGASGDDLFSDESAKVRPVLPQTMLYLVGRLAAPATVSSTSWPPRDVYVPLLLFLFWNVLCACTAAWVTMMFVRLDVFRGKE